MNYSKNDKSRDGRADAFGRRDFWTKTALAGAARALSSAPMAASQLQATPSGKGRPSPKLSGRRKLGSLEVSSVGLGVQNMRRKYETTVPYRPEMINIIRAANDRGATFFDTAEAYGPLECERILKHLPNEKYQRRRTMRRKLQIITFAVGLLLTCRAQAQTADSLFPKGDLSTTKNHTGNIWLSELNVGDSTFDPSIAQATYGPGAKLDWHIHPGGQALLITEGTGYYQERGKPVRIVHKGDVIKCQPGVEHWHGASPQSSFAYIAVTPTQKGKTIWLEPVTDKDYISLK